MNIEFENAFQTFLAGCRKIYLDNVTQTLIQKDLGYTAGKRYYKVVTLRKDERESVWAFVDTQTGDVLKAASWSAPAKHARGNIFDPYNGLKYIQWTGPMYLR
jgi:hypothetical protein